METSSSINKLHDILLSISDNEAKDEISRLREWNSEMESFLFVENRSTATKDEFQVGAEQQLSSTFRLLHRRLLCVLVPNNNELEPAEQIESIDSLSSSVLQLWNNNDDEEVTSNSENELLRQQYLRACQLLLRWYLQIYSQQQNHNKYCSSIDLIACFKTRTMLELYLQLLRKLDDPEEKRWASQLLFYSTFPTGPVDETLQQDYQYLVEQCHMPRHFLDLLWTYPPVPYIRLWLSLVRNIHNALTSFPQQASKIVKETHIDASSNSLVMEGKNDGGDWWPENPTRISFEEIFREVVIFLLQQEQTDDDDNHERRDELIIEVLRCCYAMRVSFLEYDRWRRLFDLALQPKTSYDCQLTVLPLLMDVPTEHYSLHDHVQILLTILETQIDMVMKEQYVDDRAASALTPVLTVLYRFSVADTRFCQSVELGIFPNSNVFNGEEEVVNNMAPLDAPKGTLRWKVIRLLTWPQSLVKRLAGELLWTLSGNRQQEFIRRVGMGNAIPTLGLKGLVKIPPTLHS